MPAFWDKLKKEGSADKKDDGKIVKAKPAKKDEPKKKAKKVKVDISKAALFSKILLRPIISENAMNQQVLGKYVFGVSKAANKSEIAKAVKALYGVNVEKVNILKYKPEARYFKNKAGQKAGHKKAIVTIAKGETIEIFQES